MKRCPECRKDYLDDSLLYCLDDGTALVQGSGSNEPETALLPSARVSDESATQMLDSGTEHTGPRALSWERSASRKWLPWAIAAVVVLAAIAVGGWAAFRGTS